MKLVVNKVCNIFIVLELCAVHLFASVKGFHESSFRLLGGVLIVFNLSHFVYFSSPPVFFLSRKTVQLRTRQTGLTSPD